LLLGAERRTRLAHRADLSRVSTARAFCVAAFALAAFALVGCNANQGVNPSSQQNLAKIYPNYSASNPIQYAQTSGFYGGR
jgi:hypothetical protein